VDIIVNALMFVLAIGFFTICAGVVVFSLMWVDKKLNTFWCIVLIFVYVFLFAILAQIMQ